MAAPQRIACLLASATEIVFRLGLGEQVVAISHECDYPAEAAGRPRVTRPNIDPCQPSDQIDRQVRQMAERQAPLYQIDRQRLTELAPDLILTQAQCDVCAVRYQDVAELVQSDPVFQNTHVVALNPVTPDDILQDILRVGEATGQQQAAHRLVVSLRQRIQAVRDRTAGLTEEQRPRVACIEWIDPLMLAANWMPRLVELAGGYSELTTPDQHSGYCRWDDLIRCDPQVLVIVPCGFDLQRTVQESQDLPRQPGWNQLSAVQQQRVYAADGNAYFNRSGPRIVDSLEILAHLLHPERFALPRDPDPQTAWCRLETVSQRLEPVGDLAP